MKIAALLLSLLVTTSLAHEVWIEDTPDGQLVVRFAEYGDDFEKTPGGLDMLSLPAAWTAAAEGKVTAFNVEKKTDHFLLTGASPKSPVQSETGFSVMGKAGNPEKPARKPFFYARWHVAGSPSEPALTFDIVPAATAGEATVFFRGKPTAGVNVKLYLPDGDEQEITSDEAGKVRYTATKPGLYMMAAAHQRETVPGFSGGKAYDVVSHNCSVAWRQP
ncbi:MAG: DUF4198 domain-containing protein [Verrucomicrobiaceae bacterium]|nr:MAG: DUF4198 domain-containing protein [Verrucomicrobiaceae bacterium]